jgi:hypothetical protein
MGPQPRFVRYLWRFHSNQDSFVSVWIERNCVSATRSSALFCGGQRSGGAGAGEGGGFFLRDGGLAQGAVGQADAALEALAEGPGGFQGNRKIEMSRKGHLPTDWKLCIRAAHDENSRNDATGPGGMHDNSAGGSVTASAVSFSQPLALIGWDFACDGWRKPLKRLDRSGRRRPPN